MELEDVLENLCVYDNRNPLKFSDEERKEDCYCDNCFYGRTELAEEILKLLNKNIT